MDDGKPQLECTLDYDFWVLALGTFTAMVVGTIVLLVPNLLCMVAGNASIWFLTARYAINTGTVNIESQPYELSTY